MAVETGTPPSPGPPDPAAPASGVPTSPQGPSSDAPGGPETGNGNSSSTEELSGDRNLSREQQNYRRRMKQAETERDSLRTERDALRAQLERVQTAEVERLAAAAGLSAPSDVWQFGASLDTLRTETGDIDPKTVTGLVTDILRDRPGLQVQTARIGVGRGGAAAPREPKVGLSQLLKP